MRDFLTDGSQSNGPMQAAQRAMRAPLRRRFYASVEVKEEVQDPRRGFRLLLDGHPIRTPGRRLLSAPTASVAQALAAEWSAQGELIDPATMPLTRLANTIIDGLADDAGHRSQVA